MDGPKEWRGRQEKKGNGLEVKGELWGKEIHLLVDTGATVNLLSSAWWQAEGKPGEIEEAADTLHTADGKPLAVVGRIQADLKCGDRVMAAVFLVADIASPGILGAEFLRSRRALVDLAGGKIVWPEEEAPKSRVISKLTTVVKGGCEAVVEGELVGQWREGLSGMVEGIAEVERDRGFRVGRSLVSPESRAIPLLVCNPGARAVTLYQGMHVATVEEVGPAEGWCRTVAAGAEAPVEEEAEVEAVVATLLAGAETEDLDPWRELIRRNRGAFQLNEGDLGHTDLVSHEINTGSAAPVKAPPRRLAPHRREVVDQEVETMLDKGIIEPAYGPWASPVVLVRKKDGRVRFCVDYRRLNAVTVKDAYPLPRIDDSLDSMAGAVWFSTMDLASGYWQVEMRTEDREKTAFVTHRGMFQFRVMPFGLCNAPGTFERLMEIIMRGLQWRSCLVYLDDIIVFSATLAEHRERLEEVLQRLVGAGLKVKASKCQLVRRKVGFLGHQVDANGVGTDPRKVTAVSGWPTPRSVGEVRSFLGLCGYYRGFVDNFATLAKPLSELTEKNRRFRWDRACEEAFMTLKGKLVEAPILAYPRATGKLVLDTDASNLGLGAVLSQTQDGQERVLAYASRTLTKCERNYCVTRRELLAVVFGIKKFRHYLVGRPVHIRTDHAALKWLASFKEPEGQVARWLQLIETFDYTIEHRPGRDHGNADGLSRRPCRQCGWRWGAVRMTAGPLRGRRHGRRSRRPPNGRRMRR